MLNLIRADVTLDKIKETIDDQGYDVNNERWAVLNISTLSLFIKNIP